jgi:hypothetical protein
MLTTVMSMKAMLEAMMVADRIQAAPRGQGAEVLAFMGTEADNRRAMLGEDGRRNITIFLDR